MTGSQLESIIWSQNKTKSKHFDDRPHRRGGGFCSWGKINVTLAGWEQCSLLQQSCWCCYGFFCCVHCRSDLQCFSMGQTAKKNQNCPFPLADPGPPPKICFSEPNGVYPRIGSAIFAGLTNVTNRQTDRHTYRRRDSVCSNRPHLATVTIHPVPYCSLWRQSEWWQWCCVVANTCVITLH